MSRKPCHLHLELEYKAMWVIKKLNCDFQATKEKRLLQMNELEELRNEAYDNARIYKDKTKCGAPKSGGPLTNCQPT